MKSIWNSDIKIRERESSNQELRGDKKVQTVVIGAGMAGILTAYFLKKRGQEVLVLEAGRVACGQTERTTAKITCQHALIYDKLLRSVGREKALGYARANEDAIALYEQIIREEEIPCCFERCPAYLYTMHEEGIGKLKREAKAAASLGIKAYFVPGDTEDIFKAAVRFDNQAQFHPLKFIQHLTAGFDICENTKVLSVKKHMLVTDTGKIQAENIVFATHYPFINMPGFYFLRLHQERSYVLALQGEGVPTKLSGMYYGIDKGADSGVLSLRSAEEKLLFGGGGHRTGRKADSDKVCVNAGGHCEWQPKNEGYGFLRREASKYYPHAEEVAAWAAQDCMSHDGIPFIGKYSVFRPYWHVATGFNKWGMTSSMVAASIISDRICGISNEYAQVFTPQRLLIRAGIKNLCIDIGESVAGLTKGLFGKKEKRCRHLGCHLTWNEEEESWDCPCHGSRFEKDGKLIDNPAQNPLYFK